MRSYHERLARVGLDAVDRYGFVLAGGYALSANGIGDRPSMDVDLFTNSMDEEAFSRAVDAVVSAYRDNGMTVTVITRGPLFLNIAVDDPLTGESSDIRLGSDYRELPPARLEIGPVLHRSDAVANKMTALFSRGEVRDFIDIDTVVTSGTFTRDEVLTLADARESLPLDRAMLAERFAMLADTDPEDFEIYGVDPAHRDAIVERFAQWADQIGPEKSDAHPSRLTADGDAGQLGREAAQKLADLVRHDRERRRAGLERRRFGGHMDLDSCIIAPGLTDPELDRVEQGFGFEFADDHRAFLAAGLPLDEPSASQDPGEDGPGTWGWPDWRDGDPDDLRACLDRPFDGVLFKVEHDGFWHPAWGEQPTSTAQALEAARQHLAEVPRVVPVCGHRYLPAGRGSYGNAVLSIVYPTDMIAYGADLADYVTCEFEECPCDDYDAPETHRQGCQSRERAHQGHIPHHVASLPLAPFWGDIVVAQCIWDELCRAQGPPYKPLGWLTLLQQAIDARCLRDAG